MIVVDATAVPGYPSGARTRLRGLYRAYDELPDAPEVTVLVASGTRLLGPEPFARVQVHERPFPGRRLARILRGATGLFPRHGPDVPPPRLWHSETLPPLVARDVPAFVTLHDLRHLGDATVDGRAPLQGARKRAYRAFLARVLGRCERVITVSETTRQALLESFTLSPEKVILIPNATRVAPAQGLAGRQKAQLLGGLPERFLLYVGHVEPRKGLGLLLEVLAGAPAGSPLARTTLVLAGQGPSLERLRRQAEERGVSDRLKICGVLNDAAVATLYAHAHALLLPSRLEGFGFPVFEALAHGCPVIAADLEALHGLVSPSQGVTLLPREVPLWTEALQAILDQPRRTVAFGDGPAARDWGASARGLAEVYAG